MLKKLIKWLLKSKAGREVVKFLLQQLIDELRYQLRKLQAVKGPPTEWLRGPDPNQDVTGAELLDSLTPQRQNLIVTRLSMDPTLKQIQDTERLVEIADAQMFSNRTRA